MFLKFTYLKKWSFSSLYYKNFQIIVADSESACLKVLKNDEKKKKKSPYRFHLLKITFEICTKV